MKVHVFETKNDRAQTWAKLAILSSLLSRVHAVAISLIYFPFVNVLNEQRQTKAAPDIFRSENASCLELTCAVASSVPIILSSN